MGGSKLINKGTCDEPSCASEGGVDDQSSIAE